MWQQRLSYRETFIIGSAFADVEVPIDLDKCISSIRPDNTIHASITNNAVETIILNQESMRNNPYVYLSVNKRNEKREQQSRYVFILVQKNK